MGVNAKQKRHFRQLAHHLQPVVMVSENGLGEGVINEVNRALDDHELIKVKFAIYDREERKQMIQETANQSQSEVIQVIGKLAVLYRAANNPNPKTSNLLRDIQP